MGACATKPGDLKVKGDAPVVLDDAAEKKAGGAGEADPAADGSRRRSLSDLLKENADSDVEAPAEESPEKKAEPATATVTTDETGAAATEEQITVEPSIPATEQGQAAEERGAEAAEDPHHTHAQVVVEEEKRVDPDSVQVAAVPAQSVVEESKVVAAVPAQSVVEESKVVAAVPAQSVVEEVVADADASV